MMRWIGFLLCILLCIGAAAQTTAVEVDVGAKDAWVDTGLDLRAGDSLTIDASGTLRVTQGKNTSSVTPAGANRGFRDLVKSYLVNEAGEGALIGRIGTSDAAVPFLVGANKTWKSPRAGRLYLGINKSGKDAPEGKF